MTIAESGLDALAPVDGLLVKLENGVLSVTIDRPDSLNSLTPKVLDGLADAFERAATDPRVRVVRLGGSGRGFSSGAGIGAEETGDGHEPVETLLQANRATKAIVNLPRPVVAVVRGPTAGVGVSLALACDLVIASGEGVFPARLHQDRPDARRRRLCPGGRRDRPCPGDEDGAAGRTAVRRRRLRRRARRVRASRRGEPRPRPTR